MAAHSSALAWRSPWTEGPGRLQSTGSKKIHNLEAKQQQSESEVAQSCLMLCDPVD